MKKAYLSFFALLAFFCHTGKLWACAVCFGDPNSSMSKGLSAGVYVLFGVIVCVLACFFTFFVFVGRRSYLASKMDSRHQG